MGGGPRVFSAGVVVLQNELKVDIETLKTFGEIIIRLVLVQMALKYNLVILQTVLTFGAHIRVSFGDDVPPCLCSA